MEQASRDEALPPPVTLHFPTCVRYLALVREAAEEVARRMGFDDFACTAIEMAVDEACKSTIAQSYGGECPPEAEGDDPGFTVRLVPFEDRLEVEVLDFGRGLEPRDPAGLSSAQAVSSRDASTVGLFVTARLMDEMSYQRATRSGHRLLLTKRR
jgi:anti-sigma regulatory factor (Ser/Thr protein kinase)